MPICLAERLANLHVTKRQSTEHGFPWVGFLHLHISESCCIARHTALFVPGFCIKLAVVTSQKVS